MLSRPRSASSQARQAATPFEGRRNGDVCCGARHRATGLQKGRPGRRPALKPAPRAVRRSIDERTRSPGRLLEQPTESAHRFHPVRLIEPQPLHDRGQVLRNRPALVRSEFPPRPVQQHDVVLDPDRQEPLVGRPHTQTPRGLDPSGDASDWTRIDERLEVAGTVGDGNCDSGNSGGRSRPSMCPQ